MPELTPQQKEALDIKNHISLTANAGSGKTFVLSKRFVEIILNEDVELSNIVAITFTDKAAGELNKKIATEIDQRILTEIDSEKRNRLENIRRQLVSANISTIHSFCINILKEFAPEAQIDANFNTIDQQSADELIELCLDETINALIKDPNYENDLKFLIRIFGSKKIFISELKNSIEKRRILKQLSDDLIGKTNTEIEKLFRTKFETSFNSIFSGTVKQVKSSLEKINNVVLGKDSHNKHGVDAAYVLNQITPSMPEYEVLTKLKELAGNELTKDFTIRKAGYLSKEREKYEDEINFIEHTLAELSIFFEIDLTGKSEKELAKFCISFLKIFHYSLNLYSEKKKQKGQLDFEDILLFTQQIIKLPQVQAALNEKFRYIMVDEYQDTNELQYEIFMPILDYLKSGNLFVVGDEKQSIYMFRNAELEVFNKTKNDIVAGQNTGRLLSLPHSFRMAPSIVAFTNYIFTNLFRDTNPVFNEVEYSNLICARDENENGSIEILLTNSDDEIEESELVARKILTIVGQNICGLKDIAILCRKRNSFADLEKAFVQHHIPYSIVGGKGFFQRQTIYDIYNYFSFLLNREDDAALIGILRSPFFNLSDLQLYEISTSAGNCFYEKLKNKSEQPELKSVYEKLGENLKIAFSTEMYSLVRKIFLESGYWSVLSAKDNSAQEIANVEKLLLIARGFSRKGFKNLYDFTSSLRESIEGFEDEGQAQVTRDENTVKLMTIHQAKGLEFKTVFLYGCNDTTQDSSIKSKSLSIDKSFGLITKVPLENNYFNKYSLPPIAAFYNYMIKRKTFAENKRLLYVAVTRTINNLYITATRKQRPARDSFLQLLSEGLNLDFDNPEINISSKVEFIKLIDNKYDFYDKEIKLSIPIIEKIDEPANSIILNEHENLSQRLLIQTIEDVPKNEIISATKISMFAQCPVKYYLTYELGYSTIHKLLKEKVNSYEFNSNEDAELKQYAQMRGKLIHEALKEELKDDLLSDFVIKHLTAESGMPELLKEELRKSIVEEMNLFYSSKVLAEIESHKNYKNEYEVYCEEGDHYLYGIIDKLIFDKDKLIIIDYKTDDIPQASLSSRAKNYIPQLTFYTYVLSKLYKKYSLFELRLVFLKHPDELITKTINGSHLETFKTTLNEAIEKIYSNQFKPNFNHCRECHFALEGNKCVKSFS